MLALLSVVLLLQGVVSAQRVGACGEIGRELALTKWLWQQQESLGVVYCF